MIPAKLQASIGICAYNEESNIRNLLQALAAQETSQVEVAQIVIVSSACKDATDEIVESLQQSKGNQIQLIKQSERKGKASAINLFLEVATGDVCVLESADTIPQVDTIEHLCTPFLDQRVGMTGGHPVPVDDPSTFLGFVTHFVWRLHHRVASIEPKLGELVAFRNVVDRLPEDTAVDEACVERMIKDKGYEIRYVPTALVHNKGPETVSDFLRQRRRIHNGHIQLRKSTGYKVSTMSYPRVLELSMREMERTPQGITWTLGAMAMEGYARFLGTYDFYVKKRNPCIWDIATSTKNLNLNPQQ